MTDAQWALQKAVYAALVSDSAVQAELGAPARVYDEAPADAVFPYAVLGEGRASDWTGVDGGFEHDIRLHAFSNYAGRREIKRILGAVYDALHEAPLALDGHDLVNLRFVFADAFRRLDGRMVQGVARFRAVTVKNS